MAGNQHFNNPKHWRDRAEEARILADDMHDDQSKRVMLEIAEDYEKLAERASMRLASDSAVERAVSAAVGQIKP